MAESMTDDRGQISRHPNLNLNARTRYLMAETRDLKMGTPANHPVSGSPLSEYLLPWVGLSAPLNRWLQVGAAPRAVLGCVSAREEDAMVITSPTRNTADRGRSALPDPDADSRWPLAEPPTPEWPMPRWPSPVTKV